MIGKFRGSIRGYVIMVKSEYLTKWYAHFGRLSLTTFRMSCPKQPDISPVVRRSCCSRHSVIQITLYLFVPEVYYIPIMGWGLDSDIENTGIIRSQIFAPMYHYAVRKYNYNSVVRL